MTIYTSVEPDFTYIYGLLCPFSDDIRYVGKAHNPIKRLAQHRGRRPSREGTPPVVRWVSALRELGKKPNLLILGVCPISGWQAWERWWITKLKKQGADLLNGASGGAGTDGATKVD